MSDNFVLFIIEIFTKREEDGKDQFLILKSSVILKKLWKLYERLTKVDVPPIETLLTDEKLEIFNLAKKYYSDQENLVKASKSIYILKLITNTN